MKIVKTSKLLKNKAGAGSTTYRLGIPIDFVKALELEQETNISVTLVDSKIVIEKI